MNTLHVKAWRTRMGLSRQQAADKLGVSVHTIKSYELGKRAMPAPTKRLMSKLEREKNGPLGTVPGASIRIIGGGTFYPLSNGLALCAQAYGATAKAILSLCQAHDRSATLTLTKMADPNSTLETAADLDKWIQSVTKDRGARVVFWTPTVIDGMNSALISETLERQTQLLKTLNPTLVVAASIHTQQASLEEQYEAGRAFVRKTGVNMAVVADQMSGLNMVVTAEQRFHETTDREVALAGLVEMALFGDIPASDLE